MFWKGLRNESFFNIEFWFKFKEIFELYGSSFGVYMCVNIASPLEGARYMLIWHETCQNAHKSCENKRNHTYNP